LKGRKRERGGQIIVVTAIIITIIVLSIAYMLSEAVNLRQRIRYEPYKEVVENLESSFRAAIAATLANMTCHLDQGWDEERARSSAYDYLSKWKAAAMRAYADVGLELDFSTNQDESGAYLLQGEKTIKHYLGGGKYYYEEIVPWKIYDLSQVYWDRSTGCSAINATLYVNLTEYGFYGWRHNVLVTANATIHPGTFSSKSERPPADIVLILDASDSVLFQQDYSKDDHALHLEGSIGPCDWTTVGTIDLGEVPTEFVAVLTSQGQLDFRMRKGSSTAPTLEVSYVGTDQITHTSEIEAVADSYVSSGKEGSNFGYGAVRVQSSKGDDCRTWLRFDFSDIQGSEIVKAVLRLYAYDIHRSEGRTYLACHSDDDGWEEMGITWNNKPSEGPPVAEAEVPAKGWVSFDVTPSVELDLETDGLSSWVIRDSEEGAKGKQTVYFDSKETALAGGGLTELTSAGGKIESSAEGEWMVQIKGSGPYSIDFYAEKLDRIRNAVTTFLKLLNPDLERVAIVQYGPGSRRDGPTYFYYESNITLHQTEYFYEVGTDLEELLRRLNYAEPGVDEVGYGFEKIGETVYYGGLSPMGAAIESATSIFNSEAREASNRILILVSASSEDIDPTGYNPGTTYSIYNDLIGKASLEGAVTYVIGFGEGADDPALEELAGVGGGTYLKANNGDELRRILASIAYQLNDELTFMFELKQENGIAVNTLTPSSIEVYIRDPANIRHRAELEKFSYSGGGNFTVTVSMAGCQIPYVVEVLVRDPRGIVVRLHVPLEAWRKEALEG